MMRITYKQLMKGVKTGRVEIMEWTGNYAYTRFFDSKNNEYCEYLEVTDMPQRK